MSSDLSGWISKLLQLSKTEKAPFDQLLHALQCGAPPHGGIALGTSIRPLSSSWKSFHFCNTGVFISIVLLSPHLGFDRIMAILCHTQSIRDVIAFPKTASGTDLLFKSPAPVTPGVLEEYGIAPKQLS